MDRGRQNALSRCQRVAFWAAFPRLHTCVRAHHCAGVEDYVHRIGRTGRAGATGESYTFMTYEDGKHARELSQVRA